MAEKKKRAAGQSAGRLQGQREAGRAGARQQKTIRPAEKKRSRCPVAGKCGGCTMIDVPYAEQLDRKQQRVEGLIGGFGRVDPIIRMKNPDHYRNKVTSVFAPDKKGKPVCGIYKAGTHEVVPVKACMLEDLQADRIIQTIYDLMLSFKIRVYDEDRETGFLRYVQVRTARSTKQVMVTLVTAEAAFPSGKTFVNALLKRHPEITTVVQNINDKQTTMVLGNREKVLSGPGYIEDELCKKRFRISSRSFYQVNALQTEKLYNIALDYAGFSGKERILDAYCGIGTIGIIASDRCREVLSVELNPEAVSDAKENAKRNNAQNVEVFCNDAGRFMRDLAAKEQKLDVLFMDPPRSGASEEFLASVLALKPVKIVYVSCEPDTLARDLGVLTEGGYEMKKAVPVDMFPYTEGVETVVLLSKGNISSQNVRVEFSLEDMDMSRFQQGATYEQIQKWVQEKYGFHVTHLNIAKTKRKCGIIERENYNLPKSEDSRPPETPKVKEDAIIEAFRHFQMI